MHIKQTNKVTRNFDPKPQVIPSSKCKMATIRNQYYLLSYMSWVVDTDVDYTLNDAASSPTYYILLFSFFSYLLI